MTDRSPLLAGVELGGTKCIAVIARGTSILDRAQWPTGSDPAATLDAMAEWLRRAVEVEPVAALGIASFGPLVLDPRAAGFGTIINTPKPGWSGADVVTPLAAAARAPVALDTDVAGAALAEGRWGAAQGCSTHVYLTIGTGIGGGVVIDGKPHHGAFHPELGHIRVRRHADLEFMGVCPAHGDCLEGLASGPAIAARTRFPADQLAPDHPVWDRVAGEIAELVAILVLTLAPQRIVIGGGVGHGQSRLIALVRQATGQLLAGYLPGQDGAALEQLVVASGLGPDAGVYGAIALAHHALDS